MTLWIPLLVGLAVVLVLLGRLYFRQNALIFRPGPLLDRRPSDYGIPYEEVRLPYADGRDVRAWWIAPPDGRPLVIFFHGSDGNVTHELPVIRFLHVVSVGALVVEYPGYNHDGVRPSERNVYQVAEAAWTYATEVRGIPPERIIVFGQSLGSAVAIYLAAQHAASGLVIHSGFTSVPDLAQRAYPYLPVRLFCHTQMNSLARIADCPGPVLVLHSEDDEAIPVAYARTLYARAAGPRRLVTYRGPHAGAHWQYDLRIRHAWTQLASGRTETWEHPGEA
jgi:fermentation-respiration switch protein FrsA (DUF1100 family)